MGKHNKWLSYVLLMVSILGLDVYFMWLRPPAQIYQKIYLVVLGMIFIYLILETLWPSCKNKTTAKAAHHKTKRTKSGPNQSIPSTNQFTGDSRKNPKIAHTLSADVRDISLRASVAEEYDENPSECLDALATSENRPILTDVQNRPDVLSNQDHLGSSETRIVDLSRTNLTNADLFDANLQGANLAEAELENANLWGANLFEAHLKNANISSANLAYAKLWEANLENADLTGANLQGADLRGAKLAEAIFSELALKGARYNQKTAFPDWLTQEKRDAAGMIPDSD